MAARGVENLDLSTLLGSNHFNYNSRMPEILPLLAFDDCSTYVCKGDQEGVSDSAVELSSRADEVARSDSFAL